MATTQSTQRLLNRLADLLAEGSVIIRALADPVEDRASSGPTAESPAPTEQLPALSAESERWRALAAQIHPLMGPFQAEVLDVVAEAAPTPLKVSEVAKALADGTSPTNVDQALEALTKQGVLRRDPSSAVKAYALGDRLVEAARRS